MKVRKLGLAVAMILLFGAEEQVLAQSAGESSEAWGTPTNGAQMSVSRLTVESNGQVSFRISIRNCGKVDLLLNLGSKYGNYLVPSRIHLILTDSKNTSKELDYFERRFSGVGGQIEEFIVSLPVGAIYSLRQSLNDYYCAKTGEFGLKLSPGRYRLSGNFEGQGGIGTIRDVPCDVHWGFWKGKVVSNTGEIVVASQ
jgi:hypothetical protein